jgi:predicted nicotinamide N-methyase
MKIVRDCPQTLGSLPSRAAPQYVDSMPKLDPMPEPHVYQAYGVYLLESQHRLIRGLKRLYAPSVHGDKTWRSSYLLMDYLEHYPMRRGSRVMEIGCGWGPAAVYCAKQFNAKVTGVDMDKDVFPFLDVLAELNGVEVTPLKRTFQQLKGKELGAAKLIIGSDICFWDNLITPVFNLIGRALRNGSRRIVIADPGRPTFYELCDLCANRYNITLTEWYAVEPNRCSGEILEIRP